MNARELTVPIRDGTTVRELFAAWRKRLGAAEDRFVFAVNEVWAPPETVLRDGDVLAVIPPVSGG
jgi:molybdopterin converting factor small subunit